MPTPFTVTFRYEASARTPTAEPFDDVTSTVDVFGVAIGDIAALPANGSLNTTPVAGAATGPVTDPAPERVRVPPARTGAVIRPASFTNTDGFPVDALATTPLDTDTDAVSETVTPTPDGATTHNPHGNSNGATAGTDCVLAADANNNDPPTPTTATKAVNRTPRTPNPATPNPGFPTLDWATRGWAEPRPLERTGTRLDDISTILRTRRELT